MSRCLPEFFAEMIANMTPSRRRHLSAAHDVFAMPPAACPLPRFSADERFAAAIIATPTSDAFSRRLFVPPFSVFADAACVFSTVCARWSMPVEIARVDPSDVLPSSF
jgi:hypothetical protein